EDFYRAGLIPLDRLVTYSREQDRFLDEVFEREKREGRKSEFSEDDLAEAFREVCRTLLPGVDEPFHGSRRQRAILRTATSVLIDYFISNTKLSDPENQSGSKLLIEKKH